MIAHNPNIITRDDAARVLGKQDWINGNGIIYLKTDCQCLEVRHVADIVQSLELLGIYDWVASKDRQNDVTLIVPEHHRETFEQLGINPRDFQIEQIHEAIACDKGGGISR